MIVNIIAEFDGGELLLNIVHCGYLKPALSCRSSFNVTSTSDLLCNPKLQMRDLARQTYLMSLFSTKPDDAPLVPIYTIVLPRTR